MKYRYTFSLLLIFTLGFCLSCQSQKKGKDKNEYKEDLSAVRLKYPTTPQEISTAATGTVKNDKTIIAQYDITKGLNAKMDSISERNKRIKLAEGYRILVYTGPSSEEAKQVRAKVLEVVSEKEVYTIYKQPTFRVKVGDCISRIEANNIYVKLKEQFPNAMVVPDQVNILKDK